MNACGLIVEYNPFHNGHYYHLEQSKQATNSDCMIAVMSGNFLQRGEPAITDKFHRARVAVQQGVDIVVELPFIYAVQNSDLFARGAVSILAALGVKSLCFGSESGQINDFINAYKLFQNKQERYKLELKKQLSYGISFPEASRQAYQAIGLTQGSIDLSQPNNILGFSYLKSIYQNNFSIRPMTIKRTKNNYHDKEIKNEIASATSIRKELVAYNKVTTLAKEALPSKMIEGLDEYKQYSGLWHHWEHYFNILQYRVLTMTEAELRQVHGVDEGLEYRLKRTASKATSFDSWMNDVKTKRYTWTRLQRMFAHILVNTKKESIVSLTEEKLPYIRLLAMTDKGQAYLNQIKKSMEIPIITGLKNGRHQISAIESQASYAYYSVVSPIQRRKLYKQELNPPYILNKRS
ncbi:nucleotidyltransferase [Aquibacillus halophilus]|uniref:tRNA(Met) cytidine acetate ligase n=1 Tax=Aquibacillus halophilus TaxID=930132 RepID=A0A6A8DA25_9BACI|nr:nucleotidyltransferase [Aquibacillus halophilus]MRH42150.1 nucleotidyltransferase [Aquibacillus halophilus]